MSSACALLVVALLGLGQTAVGPPAGAAEAVSFAEVTSVAGVMDPLLGMYAHAAAFADVNGDGWLDLFVGTFADYPTANYQARGATGPSPDRLLLGGPSGFREDTTFPGTLGRTTSAAFADLDNDGDPDLVIGRHTLADSATAAGLAPSLLLRNDNGRFEAGVALPAVHRGRAVSPIDYDGDGLLDLFVADDWYFGGGRSVLLRNRGGLAFEDATAAAGLGLGAVEGFAASTADLTGDGWPDLVVTGTTVHTATSTPAARVWVNTRAGGFREAPNSAFAWTTFGAEDDPAGVAAGDLNRDGRLDLVLGQHFQSGTPAPIHLYLNGGVDSGGNPVFTDITAGAGVPSFSTKAPDVQLADIDNDGWTDIVTSASAAGGTRPAVLRNVGVTGGVPHFEVPQGLGANQYWVNAAVADVDRDGRQDVFVTDFDPSRPSRLFRNSSTGGHWLDVSVDGPGQGAGSRVEVWADGALVGAQDIVTVAGFSTGLPASAHFGVGARTSVDVRVSRPRGGATSERRSVAADQAIVMTVAANPVAELVSSFTPSRLRQDFSGWVGTRLQVGATDLRVTALGRWVVTGNASSHALKLVDAASGTDVPGGAATVATAGAAAGAFRYADLSAPVTLRAGASYYLASQEQAGGDVWYDYDTHVVTSGAAAATSALYGTEASGWVPAGTSGMAYGPPSLRYTTASGSVPPSTTSTSTTSTSTTSTSTTSTSTTTTTVAGAPNAMPWVTSFTPSRLRNDFTGWVGSRLVVGASDVAVSALGRWVAPGNAGSHTVKVVTASGADVPGGSASVATAGAPSGAFAYAPLPSAVMLRAGSTYYVVTSESAGGDQWYDYDIKLVTTPVAAAMGAVYAAPTGGWVAGGSPGMAYGPVSFLARGPATTTSSSTTTTTTTTTSTSTSTTVVAGSNPDPLVVSFTPTALRRDFSGWVGMRLQVGNRDVKVSHLGRWVVAGNGASHDVKLVDAQTGLDVVGGAAAVATAGAAAGAFRYVSLASPVTLRAGRAYYLVSRESAGGDAWYDYDTKVVTTSSVAGTGAVYAVEGGAWVAGGASGMSYGPPSLLSFAG